MTLNYASLLHVLSLPSLLLNSSRLDRRLDNDLITSARRADVSLLARPTHACTCNCKFPGNQGRGQPVWSWAAATILVFRPQACELSVIIATQRRCHSFSFFISQNTILILSTCKQNNFQLYVLCLGCCFSCRNVLNSNYRCAFYIRALNIH